MKSEDRVRFLSWSSPGTSCTLALFWQGKSPNIDGFKLLHICSESESFLRKSNCSSGIKVGLQTEERYRAGLIGGRGWINVDELGMRKILSVQLPNRSALVERSGWSLIAWTSAKSNLNHCFKERRVVQRRRSTKHATISKFRRSEERKRQTDEKTRPWFRRDPAEWMWLHRGKKAAGLTDDTWKMYAQLRWLIVKFLHSKIYPHWCWLMLQIWTSALQNPTANFMFMKRMHPTHNVQNFHNMEVVVMQHG